MRLLRQTRWLLMALLLPLISATQARAGVFISVGFAPPVLPIYMQPPCPEPNLMWTPGYWAYGDDGYYWVPGAWVPAPYEGALWTPPYWGWNDGMYMFHPGYWGWHVGYYGGVNYGFGYMGVGFVGGGWRGGMFAYNTAVMRVNERIVRNVYVDRTIVERNTIVNDRRVAYSGGPGGIQHQPSPEERSAMREQHLAPTQAQQQRMQSARMDHASYFNANHGRPQQMAMARPLAAEQHAAPAMGAGARNGFAQRSGQPAGPSAPNGYPQNGGRTASPQYQQQRPAPEYRQPQQPNYNQQRPAARPQAQARPGAEGRPQSRPQGRPAAKPRPEPRPKEPQR